MPVEGGFLGSGTPREAGRRGPRRGQSKAQRKHPRGPCVPSTVTVPETISPYFSCLGARLIPHQGIATEGGLQHQCVSYERETEAQRGNYGVPGAGQRCLPHCDSPVSMRVDWASPTRQGHYVAFLKWSGVPSTGTAPLTWLLQVTIEKDVRRM